MSTKTESPSLNFTFNQVFPLSWRRIKSHVCGLMIISLRILRNTFKLHRLRGNDWARSFSPVSSPKTPLLSAGLKKWVEVGNSGVFRPEMLLPMGLPEDVSVIAWGLSLERWVSGDLQSLIQSNLTRLKEDYCRRRFQTNAVSFIELSWTAGGTRGRITQIESRRDSHPAPAVCSSAFLILDG